MSLLTVGTLEYEMDLMKLMGRRLVQADADVVLSQLEERTVTVEYPDGDTTRLCAALADVLLKDASHFELAKMVDSLPITLEDKKLILPESLRLSRRIAAGAAVRRSLSQYLGENDMLMLEGFMRFRMGVVMDAFERCVTRAAEEWILKSEYAELLRVLAEFVRLQQPRMKNIYIVLNANGSCTLTDDEGSRIDYDSGSDDGVVSMLVGLAPERVTVYDLSCGRGSSLVAALAMVFEDKIRFFS